MRDLFPIVEQQYSPRNGGTFQLPKVQTKAFWKETALFLGCGLWNTLPNEWKLLSKYELCQKNDKAMRWSTCIRAKFCFRPISGFVYIKFLNQ